MRVRAAILPRDRVPHHRALAVVDLPFLTGRGHDHLVRLGRALAAQRDKQYVLRYFRTPR